MALKLKGSTSGFVGLDAPAVSGNNTLILPENSGSAFQLFANDITAGVTTFTSVSVNRNGDLTVPGTISIGGTLTYEDVTSVDSVGVVTARGLSIFGNTTGLSVSGIATITKGASGGAAANSDAALIIDNNSNNYIQLRSPNTTGQGILFGDDADNDIGSVAYNHNINSLAFTVNANERLRIDSSGQVGLSVTPDTWSTGHGLTIGTSQATLWGTGDQINLSGNAYFNSGWKAAATKAGASQIQQALGQIDFKVSGSVTADAAITFIDALSISNTGDISLPVDNKKLKFGAGNDLQIYHGSDQNYVSATGTGNLNLTSASSVAVKVNSTEDAIVCNINGSVDLYHNGNRQVFTIDGGLNWQDSKKAEFGNGGDLKIYHESDVSIIKSASHPIAFYTNTRHHFLNADGSENLAVFTPNGSCALYHNGDLRLQTWSDAVNIYGDEGEDAILHLYADDGDDNADKWRLLAGTAGQLDIANYSTGSWVNHLTINGSGHVTKPATPAFRAGRHSSSQNVNAGDAIVFNYVSGGSIHFNQGNHYSTTTGKFTAPVAGVYSFFTHVIYQGLSDGQSMIDVFHMYINNTQAGYSHKRGEYIANETGNGGYYTDTGDLTAVKLAVGDEVWVRNAINSLTIHANPTYCTFSGFLVG